MFSIACPSGIFIPDIVFVAPPDGIFAPRVDDIAPWVAAFDRAFFSAAFALAELFFIGPFLLAGAFFF
jgi:hypothetical protein